MNFKKAAMIGIILAAGVFTGAASCSETGGQDEIQIKEVKRPDGKRMNCVLLYEDKPTGPSEPSGIDCDWANAR